MDVNKCKEAVNGELVAETDAMSYEMSSNTNSLHVVVSLITV